VVEMHVAGARDVRAPRLLWIVRVAEQGPVHAGIAAEEPESAPAATIVLGLCGSNATRVPPL
jgi:hypothetical protein